MKISLNVFRKRTSIIILILAALVCSAIAQSNQISNDKTGDLQSNFINPPDEAKPRVWWHWMNGNISKDGIKKDLEWMKRTGIGGFQNFDVSALLNQTVVEKRLVYMTPEWKDAFLFTTNLADSLGLEMAIASSPGWSESGGPWVKPEQAMKKLVWSEISVEGGKLFSGKLPEPPHTTGPFLNLKYEVDTLGVGKKNEPTPEFYDDVAVIAYRIPESKYLTTSELHPKLTSSDGNINLNMLIDGDFTKTMFLPPKDIGKYAWVQFEFRKPESIKSLTFASGVKANALSGGNSDDVILEAGNDGVNFSKITDIPVNKIGHVTLTFSPVTAKYFRFAFKSKAPASDLLTLLGISNKPKETRPAGIEIAELCLYNTARVNRFEEKAGFAISSNLNEVDTFSVSKTEVISKMI